MYNSSWIFSSFFWRLYSVLLLASLALRCGLLNSSSAFNISCSIYVSLLSLFVMCL